MDASSSAPGDAPRCGVGGRAAGGACGCPLVPEYAPPPLLTFGGESPYVRGGASFAPADPPAGPPVHGGEETEGDPLGKVTTNTCECSEFVKRQDGEPCSSKRVVAAITEFVKTIAPGGGKPPPGEEGKPPPGEEQPGAEPGTEPEAEPPRAGLTPQTAVRQAAEALGCTSESCVVTNPKFQAFARSAFDLGERDLDKNLKQRFKPVGPRTSTNLLSNFNIDQVLSQWAAIYPTFFNYGFNMIDFEAVGGSLARIDVADILRGRAKQDLGPLGGATRRPCDTFACVLNTDVSTGKGKHWVALFGDCRGEGDWSVEYFNSAGNPPPPEVTRWLEATAARLSAFRAAHPRLYGAGRVEAVPLTDVRHQNSRTECGVYTLYFIRSRLEGRPYSEFRSGRIPDEAMTEFRRHVFRGEK